PPSHSTPNCPTQHLPSFPTRRSSDLTEEPAHPPYPWLQLISHHQTSLPAIHHPPGRAPAGCNDLIQPTRQKSRQAFGSSPALGADRKSTRLNSSHLGISYAVFCLKKK